MYDVHECSHEMIRTFTKTTWVNPKFDDPATKDRGNGDDAVIVASDYYTDLYIRATDDDARVVVAQDAVADLTSASNVTIYNFQVTLHLLAWHSLLGAFVPVAKLFNKLEVKHVLTVSIL